MGLTHTCLGSALKQKQWFLGWLLECHSKFLLCTLSKIKSVAKVAQVPHWAPCAIVIQYDPTCRSDLSLLLFFFIFPLSHCQIVVSFSASPTWPNGERDCLAPELANNVKAKLEESEGDVCVALRGKKNLRLVNQHWSLWAI